MEYQSSVNNFFLEDKDTTFPVESATGSAGSLTESISWILVMELKYCSIDTDHLIEIRRVCNKGAKHVV
jgi:hypothetical protein